MRREAITDSGNKQLICKICGEVFTFSTGEQSFYRDRGLAEPRRCPACRRSHRQSINEKRGVEK